MLSPEKQIKLERALSGFDIHRMAADDTYAATFFLERMVAPHSGNPALYPELAIALQPMSTLLYNIISDHSADVLASETHLDAQAPDSATAA